jgi:hypothetical protein
MGTRAGQRWAAGAGRVGGVASAARRCPREARRQRDDRQRRRHTGVFRYTSTCPRQGVEGYALSSFGGPRARGPTDGQQRSKKVRLLAHFPGRRAVGARARRAAKRSGRSHGKQERAARGYARPRRFAGRLTNRSCPVSDAGTPVVGTEGFPSRMSTTAAVIGRRPRVPARPRTSAIDGRHHPICVALS